MRAAVGCLFTLAVTVCAQSLVAQQPTIVPRDTIEPPPIEAGVAPRHGVYAPGFNALHYDIALELPDTGRVIRARTTIHVALREPRSDTLSLDFTGLAVDAVGVNGGETSYRYDKGKLRIPVSRELRTGDTLHVQIYYHGVPDDGLIIRDNVHGERSIFADNWPDRARFWFPSIDHPSDKATVAFAVSAPANWQLIANGTRLFGNRPAGLMPDPKKTYFGPRVLWRWGTDIPIPTYTMVIGTGKMQVVPIGQCADAKKCLEITTWSFRQDSASMARSFARAREIVQYFSRLVAPFPYEKLAHVESSTRFGGMENASAIFYDEKAIAEGQNIEGTVAHETAHQWFGDGATEREWQDLWLSEGFATYFAALFFEHADGVAKFRTMLRADRDAYIKSDAVNRPVVDSAQTSLFALLNTNSYQKGGWVLHMLRGTLGDSLFFRGIRRYYEGHRNGNATTSDLRAALESVSGRDLGGFFEQWLYRPGYPQLRTQLSYDRATRNAKIVVTQVQPNEWPTFRFPIDVQLTVQGRKVRRTFQVTERTSTFQMPVAGAPTRVLLDPDDKLLMSVVR